jgi:spore coat polysaccharide biosynthesis protein SpsF (cytidylyltransferase family)
VLYEAAIRAQAPYDREHVTPYMKRHFSVAVQSCPTLGLDALRWTIDTADDYAFASRVYDRLYADVPLFGWRDVLTLSELDHAYARTNGR